MTTVKYSNTWMNYLKKYKQMFDDEKIKLKSGFNKTAVIIDSRIDDLLELVIKNFMYILHNEWNLMIFYTSNNKEYIQHIVKDIGEVKIVEIKGVKDISPSLYNNLLKS
jgi:hypothetical protein